MRETEERALLDRMPWRPNPARLSVMPDAETHGRLLWRAFQATVVLAGLAMFMAALNVLVTGRIR